MTLIKAQKQNSEDTVDSILSTLDSATPKLAATPMFLPFSFPQIFFSISVPLWHWSQFKVQIWLAEFVIAHSLAAKRLCGIAGSSGRKWFWVDSDSHQKFY